MPTTPFATVIIAARQDLEATLASLDLIAQADGGEQDRRITNASLAAKEELKNDLEQVAPDIFANSVALYADFGSSGFNSWTDWFYGIGITWDKVDTMLDVLFNPLRLKDTYVACWKWKLYTIQVEDLLGNPDAVKTYESQRDYWERLYRDRYEKAWRLLQFDLNGDGKIQPGERLRTRNTIRVR